MKNTTTFLLSINRRTILFIVMVCATSILKAQTTVTLSPGQTWTVPAGVTSATFHLWGGGGGGAGSNTSPGCWANGGGGGGGACITATPTGLVANTVFTFTGGAGGAGSSVTGTPGGNGGTTTFSGGGLSYTAAGGSGAAGVVTGNGNNSAGGSGGSTGSGTTSFTKRNGGNGSRGENGTNFIVCFGGTSGGGGGGGGTSGTGGSPSNGSCNFGSGGSGTFLGGDGGDNPQCGNQGNAPGQNGANFGGGGAGCVNFSGSAQAGGNGGQGRVIVIYTAPCSGTPVPGATAATLNPVCTGESFTLSFPTIPSGSGISYQWQSSSNGSAYSNIGGATNTTLTTSQSASTFYRCNVSCSGGGTGTSTPLQVLLIGPTGMPQSFASSTFPPCGWVTNNTTYCGRSTSSAFGSGTGSAIFNFYNADGVNFNMTSPTFPAVPSGTTFTFDFAYSAFDDNGDCNSHIDEFRVMTSTDGGANYTILEQYFGGTSAGLNPFGLCSDVEYVPTSGQWSSKTISLPAGTNSIRLRALSGFGNNLYIDNLNLNIPAACSGAPAPGNTLASTNNQCMGVPVKLSMQNGNFAGMTYNWQSSPNNTSYTSIAGASNATLTIQPSANAWYKCIVTCTGSGQSASSNPVQVTVQPCINMPDGLTINTCSATFYDIGGSGANYNNNEDNTVTICPNSAGSMIRATFSSFNTESNWDPLYIYNGPNTSSSLFSSGNGTSSGGFPAGGFWGTSLPGGSAGFTSTNATGCLTFEFKSDETTRNPGWVANITCIAPCSGTPTGGTTTVSSGSPFCPATSFTLTATGATVNVPGITYQWQTSPNNSTWTNASGATNTTFTTTQNSATWYRCVVTCTNSNLSANSTALQVQTDNFINCYCASAAASILGAGIAEEIYKVTLNGSSTPAPYANNCNQLAPGPGSLLNRYSNFKTLPALSNLIMGVPSTFTVEENICNPLLLSNFGTAIFVDYNHNGSFTDAGEKVFVENNTASSPRNVTGTFTAPPTALPGPTVMRVLVADGTSGSNLTPCLNNYTAGETEDWIVNIIPPNATSNSPVCTNDTIKLFAPTTGVSFSWTTTASNGFTSNVQNPIILTSDASDAGIYTVVVNTGSGSYSASVTVVVNPPPTLSASASAPFCAGTQNLQLSATAPGGGTFVWTGPGGYGSTVEDPIRTGTTSSMSGTYTVKVTNANGCTNTASTSVTIFPLPVIDIVVIGRLETHLCTGDTSVLQGTGAGITGTYLWSTSQTGSDIIITTGGTYTVTGTDLHGCHSNDQVTLTQSAPPAAPIVVVSAGDTNLCTSDGINYASVTLHTTNYNDPNMEWNTGFDLGPDVTINYISDFNVTIRDAFTCTAVSNTISTHPKIASTAPVNSQITSNVPGNVTCAVPVTLTLTPQTINLTAPGYLGSDAHWEWFLDGSSCGTGTPVGTGAVITVTPPTTPGAHTYSVRAVGYCNTTSCASIVITVKDPSVSPTSSLASPAVICEGDHTILSVSGGSLGTGASWKLYENTCGGAALQSSSSPSFIVTPQSPGLHTYFIRAEGDCNNTVCSMIVVDVKDSSAQAVSLSSSATDICEGTSVTMDLSGGHLGRGAVWSWYEGGCGNGAALQSSSATSLTLTPLTGLHTYYVRAEGDCNNTLCRFVTVNVKDSSEMATASQASPAVICEGDQTTLSASGGHLGTGAAWMLYENTCGGVALQSSSSPSFTLTPQSPGLHTYFIRAEGDCNNTVCNMIVVDVKDSSAQAVSLSSSATDICEGTSVTMDLSGGHLGRGGVWSWYEGGCGNGAALQSSSSTSLTLTPLTGLHTYYVRAEGDCNNTLCQFVTVNVKDSSEMATSSLASPAVICEGDQTTLSASGGHLGTGAAWMLYENTCGGVALQSSSSPSFTLTPQSPGLHTYFIRAEGDCNNTVCSMIVVDVKDSSAQAVSLSSSATDICEGDAVTMNLSGGHLGRGAVWSWYEGGCGNGAALQSSSSASLTIIPQTIGLHTYYVRAEGDCNNTLCQFVTVNVKDSSERATSSLAFPSVICEGNQTMLFAIGGHLGTGATWKLYENSCGGVSLQSSSSPSFTVIPQSPGLHTYFIRAEGDCNNTVCSMIVVDVKDSSSQAVSLSSSASNICEGDAVTMNLSGGHLGRGAVWSWYEGGCGNGAAIQSSSSTSLTLTPQTIGLHTYYVRAEGDCNNTLCQFVTVNVKDSSEMATSSLASPAVICEGDLTVLSVSGGHLGTGASWKLYENTCGGAVLQSSSSPSFTVIPQSPGLHNYFIRAEGDCNNTVCRMIVVDVKDSSAQASALLTSAAAICEGSSVTLNISGGHLGRGAVWKWYESGCGTGAVLQSGASTSLTVTPLSGLHTYYVRAEGDCNTTLCRFVSVFVKDSSEVATSASASQSIICLGSQVTLSVGGGFLGTNANWKWYSGSCGGTLVGIGSTVNVNPVSTTTYFVRAEGDCNTTLCKSTTVTVRTASTDPTSATSSAPVNGICIGGSVTLNVIGGSLGNGAIWVWYEDGCGSGNSIGTGSTLTIVPAFEGLHSYYVRAEGPCNVTNCAAVSVLVGTYSIEASSITSTVVGNSICLGNNIALTVDGGFLGTVAQWKWYTGSCGGAPVGTGPSITVAPTSTKVYFARAEGSCNVTICKSITVNVSSSPPSNPPPTITTAPNGICSGNGSTVACNASAGATYYSWSAPNGTTFDGNNPSPYITTSNSVQVTFGNLPNGVSGYDICVFAGNGCGTTVTKCRYIRGRVQSAQTINGNASSCPNTSSVYSIVSLPGADSYTWSVTGAATINGGGTTLTTSSTSVTVNFLSGWTSGTLSVYGSMNCGYNAPTKTINIISTPVVPGVITGPTLVCPSGAYTYSIAPVAGAVSYNWSTNVPGAIIGAGTTSRTITFPSVIPAAATVSVTATGSCGTSAPRIKNIATGMANTPGTISGPAMGQCGQTGGYSILPVPGATSYLWTANNGATISGLNNITTASVVFPANFTTSTVSVIAINGCGNSAPQTKLVTGAPANPGPITGTAAVCVGAVQTYSVTGSVGATAYVWNNPPGSIILSGQNTATISILYTDNSGGNVTVYASNACGVSTTSIFGVSVICRLAQISQGSLIDATIYPNPTVGTTTLKFETIAAGDYKVSVVDMTGQIMQMSTITAEEGQNLHELDLSTYAKGLYMVRLEREGEAMQMLRVTVE